MLIASYITGGGAFAEGNHGTPTGMTGHTENDMQYSTHSTNHQFLSASGSTGTRVSSSTVNDNWAGMLFAVKGASASTTEKTGSDSATLSDDTGTFPWAFNDKTDSQTVTDTVTTSTRTTALTDSAALTDAAALQRQNALTDSASLTDDASVARQNSLTDASTITDSSSVLKNYFSNLTDTATFTDTSSLVKDANLSSTDASTLTDSSSPIFVTYSLNDTATTSETAQLFTIDSKTASDSATLTDTQAGSRTTSVTDSATTTDESAESITTTAIDSATLTDSSSTIKNIAYNVTDSLTISESISSSRTTSVTDSATITDLSSSPGDSNLIDSATLTDNVTSVSISQTRTDTATLAESSSISQFRVDSFLITDVSSIFKSEFYAVIDAATTSDVSILSATTTKTESSTATDTAILVATNSLTDSASFTDSAIVNIVVSDSATQTNTITSRTLGVADSATLNDVKVLSAFLVAVDSAEFLEDAKFVGERAQEINLNELVAYTPPKTRPYRIIAQNIFTRQFVHWDLPMDNLQIKKTVSGPCIISGTINTEMLNLQDLDPGLEPDATFLHFEEDGQIRATGILMPFTDDNKSKTRTIEAEGISAYAKWRYYQGESYQGIQVDPADMFRLIWDYIQEEPAGDMGITISPTKTPVLIGTEPENVEFETGEGEDVSFVAGPYALNFWSVTNLGDEIDKLCKETPMEFIEHSKWNASKTDVLLDIDLKYPRAGRRRDDLGFREGENFFDLIPTYSENKDTYASEVVVVGAGDGPDAIRQRTRGIASPPRLHKTVVIQNENITNTDRALAISQFEFRRRALSKYEIQSITIDTTSPNAPYGAFEEGDDILVEGFVQYIGQVADLHRIVSYTYDPKAKIAVLDLKPSESFDYGALKVED
jgi:hypothetical protein